METIPKELLRILRCPVGNAPLIELKGWLYSTDPHTRRRYPIRDGIPVLLVDESEEVERDEFKRVMAAAGVETAPETTE